MSELKRKKQVYGVTPNAKIKNATKLVVDGVKFDSRLEYYMYTLLQGAGIEFDYQKTFVLQPKFRYRTENVRAICKIVDFHLESRNIICETKGFSNDVSPIKHKMLKFALLKEYGISPDVVMVKNKKECDEFIEKLK